MDGAALARKVRAAVAGEVAELGHVGLATVLVGEDPASQVYIGLKHKAATEAGFEPTDHRLPASTSQSELLRLVEELNGDEGVDGLLVQLPLPDHIDEGAVLRAIEPVKDVDGVHPMNAGFLDSPRFAAREKATREIEQLGEAALPALRRVLAQTWGEMLMRGLPGPAELVGLARR